MTSCMTRVVNPENATSGVLTDNFITPSWKTACTRVVQNLCYWYFLWKNSCGLTDSWHHDMCLMVVNEAHLGRVQPDVAFLEPKFLSGEWPFRYDYSREGGTVVWPAQSRA